MMRGAVPSAAIAAVSLALAGCAPQGPFAELRAMQPPERSLATTPDALIAEGTALLQAGEPDQAYKRFISALRIGGPPAKALTGAGLALEAQGLLRQAREYLERARNLAPGWPTAHNNLGVVQYKLGDYAAARQSFRAAYAISSGTNAIAAINLGAAEQALAARAPARPADITHTVQRLGGGVYTIAPIAPGDRLEVPLTPSEAGGGAEEPTEAPTAEDVPEAADPVDPAGTGEETAAETAAQTAANTEPPAEALAAADERGGLAAEEKSAIDAPGPDAEAGAPPAEPTAGPEVGTADAPAAQPEAPPEAETAGDGEDETGPADAGSEPERIVSCAPVCPP